LCSQPAERLGVVRRGPSRQIAGAARQVDPSQRRIVEGQRSRSVVERHRQIRPHPVEDRHEVVAKHIHAGGVHGANALGVVVDQRVAGRQPELDVLVNGDALDDRKPKPGAIDTLR
jgi:hypothetical protein